MKTWIPSSTISVWRFQIIEAIQNISGPVGPFDNWSEDAILRLFHCLEVAKVSFAAERNLRELQNLPE